MQLRRLRHQILLAMGLPACWTSPSPAPMTPITSPDHDKHVANPHDGDHPGDGNKVATNGDPWQWQANPAASVRMGCVPETVCGRSDTKHGPVGCGPHGDSLESFAGNYQKLSITKLSWAANPGELRLFDLDAAETQQYQRTVTVQSGVDRYCCYSHCTPERPASRIPVPPQGMQLSVNCFAAPLTVSNASHDNRDCPATQGQDPYVRGTDAQCCFASFVPTPPPFDPNQQRHYRGRAARVDGDVVMAPVRPGSTWTRSEAPPPRADHLAPNTRTAQTRVDHIDPDTRTAGPRVDHIDPGTRTAGPRVDHLDPGTRTAGPRVDHLAPGTRTAGPRVDHLAPDTRAALRDAWSAAAQMEHASIAAFSALSLRMMALGAPADLLARVHAAALDEIRHAQIAFALASAYAGTPLEPARFADVARLAVTSTLADLAIETFLDGCIEETAAAVDASLAAQTAEDPAIAAALRSIADDETRHAELAWAIVAWCVRTDPAIGSQLHAHLADQLVRHADGVGPYCSNFEQLELADPMIAVEPLAPNALARHGVRSPAESARTKASVLRDVVAPCLAALIDPDPVSDG